MMHRVTELRDHGVGMESPPQLKCRCWGSRRRDAESRRSGRSARL